MTGRNLTAVMIVFALIVVPLAAYVGGYYGLANTTDYRLIIGMPDIQRTYRQRWQSTMFKPAAKVESWLTGVNVSVHCIDDAIVY